MLEIDRSTWGEWPSGYFHQPQGHAEKCPVIILKVEIISLPETVENVDSAEQTDVSKEPRDNHYKEQKRCEDSD